jgi:hypothetical protein
VLATRSVLLHAQQSVPAHLGEEAQKLQQDIEVLKQSKSELASRVSSSLLSNLSSEILAKEASLKSIQEKIRQAQAAQTDVDALTRLKGQMESSASSELLKAINQEISNKQQTLAILAEAQPGSETTSGGKNRPSESSQPVPPAIGSSKDNPDPPVTTTTGGLCSSRSNTPFCIDQPTGPPTRPS